MAKSGFLESDPSVTAKATELKKELQKLVKNIVEEDDCSTLRIDQVQETLSSLKQLKTSNSNSNRSLSSKKAKETVSFPEEFRCPLSKELMRDPVIVASGQTFDRPFIQKWLNSGNRTCPKTEQVLSNSVLIPNQLVKEMISNWCVAQRVEIPSSNDSCGDANSFTQKDRDNFHYLIDKLSATLSEQKEAAKELRMLTKRLPPFRALFGEYPDMIPHFLAPLKTAIPLDLQEDMITTLLNFSIYDSNKKIVCETPEVIHILMEAIKKGTIATRSNAAATLFTLSAVDSNKELIGRYGALKPLIDLLREGHSQAMKDVASAIFNLCILHENRSRAVKDGTVSVIIEKINQGMNVDELLSILTLLSSHQKTIEEISELGAVSCLFRVIRESSSNHSKENSIAILHTIFLSDRTKLKEFRDEENSNRTISKLLREGTSRAQRKAVGILDRLNRVVTRTHTA